MHQMKNQISLYKKVDAFLSEIVGISVSKPTFTYNHEDNRMVIELDEEFNGVATINEYDTIWSPNEHNLNVQMVFTFKHPDKLFGPDSVTMPANRIGLGVHLHSKTSSIQKTLDIGILYNASHEIRIPFQYEFNISEIRGDVNLDFFLYLKECLDQRPSQATKIGMRLSEDDLYNLTIVADGDGSAFPITEFAEKDGPLWRLERNWVDAAIDAFDTSNVNLALNVSHPLFGKLKEGKTAVNRAMMGDVMVQAITMIIQEVIIVEKLSLDEEETFASDSILSAVKYWVETFEVDTSTLFSIANSLRENLERTMMEDTEND